MAGDCAVGRGYLLRNLAGARGVLWAIAFVTFGIAYGVYLRPVGSTAIVRARVILAARTGAGCVMTAAITERVLRGLEHLPRDVDSLHPPDALTKRELEVLRLMAGGYSNREIAEALGTSEGTIKNHASSILSKPGVRDRTRAVLKGVELGYI